MAFTAAVSFGLSASFRGLSLSPSSSSSYLKGDFGVSSLNNRCSVSFPASSPLSIEAAHKKGAGSTKNGRDSRGQRLGVKIYGDQVAKPGAIIVRQRGTKVSVYPRVVQPENPNSYKARRREYFRLQRERLKAKKEGTLSPQLVLASKEEVPEEAASC